jgi:hypothetical protein
VHFKPNINIFLKFSSNSAPLDTHKPQKVFFNYLPIVHDPQSHDL